MNNTNSNNNNTLASICLPFAVAQKLKQLGVPQKSCFYYLNMPSGMDFNGNHFVLSEDALQIKANNMSYSYKEKVAFSVFSAFTLQELGDLLPTFIKIYQLNQPTIKTFTIYELYINRNEENKDKNNNNWLVYYRNNPDLTRIGVQIKRLHLEENESELLARSNMLIWLLENGYLKFGEDEKKKGKINKNG